MAIYHLSAQVIGRGSGRSSIAAAAYRSGEKLKNELTGDAWDFRKKTGVAITGIEAPEGVPDWAKDRTELWNEVERKENRVNSRFAREFNIALPAELTLEENTKLLKDFISENFTKRGLVSDWAIHDPKDTEKNPTAHQTEVPEESDNRNIHAHIMTTTRKIDRDGWTEKDREGNRLEALQEIRESWAKTVNKELERKGLDERIDHRTLEAQGINREPQQHMGPKATALERREETPDRKRFFSEEREIEPPSQIKDTAPTIAETDEIRKDSATLKAYELVEKAMDNPEEWKKVTNHLNTTERERRETIEKTAGQNAVKVMLEQLEKRFEQNAEQMEKTPTKNLEEMNKKIAKAWEEANEVSKPGNEKKLAEYIEKQRRQNTAFEKEYNRQIGEVDKLNERNPMLELIRKEMQEIERIREEERQRIIEQEREQGRGRGR